MRLRKSLNISELLKIQHVAENGAFFSRTLTSFVSDATEGIPAPLKLCIFHPFRRNFFLSLSLRFLLRLSSIFCRLLKRGHQILFQK